MSTQPHLLGELLPAGVVAVEAFDDDIPAPLYPAEELLLARAVDKRRREFATARRCARQALTALGYPPAPLLTGERGAPLWPVGVVGSITHCAGYRAAAVAPGTVLWSLGVDAEPDEPLPEGVLASIADDEEADAVNDLLDRDASVRWDRLLFSAKEAVYKAWFPLTQRWLEFDEASVAIDPAGGWFAAQLLVAGPTLEGRELTGFSGRWLARGGLLLTAVAVANSPSTA